MKPGGSLKRRAHCGASIAKPLCCWAQRSNSRHGLFIQVREYSKLLVHRHEIEVVPAFDDLFVLEAGDCNPGELNCITGRREAECFTAMPAAYPTTCDDFISLGDGIFNCYFQVRQRTAEFFQKR